MAESSSSSRDKANPVIIILSVLIPLVGFILYFVKKDKTPNAANSYLWSAIAGFIVNLILWI